MGRIEKTVFISYRRTNFSWALAIYQDLTQHGFDVFIDYTGIASGSFETVIIENIHARAHFVVLLTPSALERCSEPGDWLRREIETALEVKRNIVPLMLEGFDFSSPKIVSQLKGRLAELREYNGLEVPAAFFAEAMKRLRDDYLNVSLDAILRPPSVAAQEAAKNEQARASTAPAVSKTKLAEQESISNVTTPDPPLQKRLSSSWFVQFRDFRWHLLVVSAAVLVAVALGIEGIGYYRNKTKQTAVPNTGSSAVQKTEQTTVPNTGTPPVQKAELTAEDWFHRGLNATDPDQELAYYSEAIRLKPDYAYAFNNRGVVRKNKGDLDGALKDYNEAIRLKPDYADAFNNRGNVRHDKGDLDGALRDYDDAIRLKPDYADAFNGRGYARYGKGDLDGALRDYDEAIRLKPDYAYAFYNRGNARKAKGDFDGALKDYNEAIRLKPDYADAFYNRAMVRKTQGNLQGAAADYQKYLDLGGGKREGDQAEVEKMIRDLKSRLPTDTPIPK